jgi:squalene-hopene/tetraprenyl-beta-curcumene cyclase
MKEKFMKSFKSCSSLAFCILVVAATAGCGGDSPGKRGAAGGKAPVKPAGSGGGAAAGPRAGSQAPAKGAAGEVTAAAVKAAAEKAAGFLVSKQNPDGSFGRKGPLVGMTGLVVIALAETGAGGEAGKAAVEKAVKWMLGNRQKDGGVYFPALPYNSYETSITAMALASVDKAGHREVIDGCVRYLKGIQDDGSKQPLNKGGIGYGSKGVNSNMSTTHYALQAFKAAGLKEDDEAWKKAVAFISICQNQSETNQQPYAAVINDGGFIYSPAGGKTKEVVKRGKTGWRSYGSMTYAGYLSYVYAGLAADDPRVKGAEKWISANYTLEENPALGAEGLYYYYQTFALALDARGSRTLKLADGREVEWARDLGARLLALQGADGSWINREDRWKESDPLICGSYALRALGRVQKWLAAE